MPPKGNAKGQKKKGAEDAPAGSRVSMDLVHAALEEWDYTCAVVVPGPGVDPSADNEVNSESDGADMTARDNTIRDRLRSFYEAVTRERSDNMVEIGRHQVESFAEEFRSQDLDCYRYCLKIEDPEDESLLNETTESLFSRVFVQFVFHQLETTAPDVLERTQSRLQSLNSETLNEENESKPSSSNLHPEDETEILASNPESLEDDELEIDEAESSSRLHFEPCSPTFLCRDFPWSLSILNALLFEKVKVDFVCSIEITAPLLDAEEEAENDEPAENELVSTLSSNDRFDRTIAGTIIRAIETERIHGSENPLRGIVIGKFTSPSLDDVPTVAVDLLEFVQQWSSKRTLFHSWVGQKKFHIIPSMSEMETESSGKRHINLHHGSKQDKEEFVLLSIVDALIDSVTTDPSSTLASKISDSTDTSGFVESSWKKNLEQLLHDDHSALMDAREGQSSTKVQDNIVGNASDNERPSLVHEFHVDGADSSRLTRASAIARGIWKYSFPEQSLPEETRLLFASHLVQLARNALSKNEDSVAQPAADHKKTLSRLCEQRLQRFYWVQQLASQGNSQLLGEASNLSDRYSVTEHLDSKSMDMTLFSLLCEKDRTFDCFYDMFFDVVLLKTSKTLKNYEEKIHTIKGLPTFGEWVEEIIVSSVSHNEDSDEIPDPNQTDSVATVPMNRFMDFLQDTSEEVRTRGAFRSLPLMQQSFCIADESYYTFSQSLQSPHDFDLVSECDGASFGLHSQTEVDGSSVDHVENINMRFSAHFPNDLECCISPVQTFIPEIAFEEVVHEGAESVSRADSFKKILRLCASKDIAYEIICRSLASSESGQLTVRALLHGEILQVPREHGSETEHHLHDSCPLFVGDVLSVAGIKPPCSEGSSKNKEILSEICYELRDQSVLETKDGKDDEECTDSRLPDHGSLAHVASISVKQHLVVEIDRRFVCASRSLVRRFSDGWFQILGSDGSVHVFQPGSSTWIFTHPNGSRDAICLKDGTRFELPPVRCSATIDPQTGGQLVTREDYVLMVQYPDGSNLVQHADGTRIWTDHSTGGSSTIRFEHPKFFPVVISGPTDSPTDISVELPGSSMLSLNILSSSAVIRTISGPRIYVREDDISNGQEELSRRVQIAVDILGILSSFRGDCFEPGIAYFSLQSGHGTSVERSLASSIQSPLFFVKDGYERCMQLNQNCVLETSGDLRSPAGLDARYFVVNRDGSGIEMKSEEELERLLNRQKFVGSNPVVVKEPVLGYDREMESFTLFMNSRPMEPEQWTNRLVPRCLLLSSSPKYPKANANDSPHNSLRFRQLLHHTPFSPDEILTIQQSIERWHVWCSEMTHHEEILLPEDTRTETQISEAMQSDLEAAMQLGLVGRESVYDSVRRLYEQNFQGSDSDSLDDSSMSNSSSLPQKHRVYHRQNVDDNLIDDSGASSYWETRNRLGDSVFNNAGQKYLDSSAYPSDSYALRDQGILSYSDDDGLNMDTSYEYDREAEDQSNSVTFQPYGYDDEEEPSAQLDAMDRLEAAAREDRLDGEHHSYRIQPASRENKRYNVFGQPRKLRNTLPSLMKNQASAIPNRNRSTLDSLASRQIHTSSTCLLAERRSEAHLMGFDGTKVPQGVAFIDSALDMPHEAGVAHFSLVPSSLRLGSLIHERTYRVSLKLTNTGHDNGRIRVRPLEHPGLRAIYKKGPIPPGLSITIEVEIATIQLGPIEDELLVESEHEILRVPITADVIESISNDDASVVLRKGVRLVASCLPDERIIRTHRASESHRFYESGPIHPILSSSDARS